jgi:hypothetical protein
MSFLVGVPGKLKTLLDRLTAARAVFLDYIDTLNTRWSASAKTDFDTIKTKVDTLHDSRLTAARASNLDNFGYLNVQHFSGVTMSGTTLDQAITAVSNTAKAFIIMTWSVENSGPTAAFIWNGSNWEMTLDQRPHFPRARFTSTSNVRVERGGAGSPGVSLKINLMVVEWKAS